MAAISLEGVLTSVESLSTDERMMLEDLLRNRRIEAWRSETAAHARKAVTDLRAGKLKSQSATDVIACLREGLEADAG